MHKHPKILATKTVAKSRLFTIEQVQLEFANGERREFERMSGKHHGAVLIVPMLDDETILLVREYACGHEAYELGFPKGLVEDGEEILTGANRELMEEVGYGAHSLTMLTKMSLAPAYFRTSTYIILAKDLYEKKLPGDEPESIEVVPWKLNNIQELLARDDFSEARSIAALLWIQSRLPASNNQ